MVLALLRIGFPLFMVAIAAQTISAATIDECRSMLIHGEYENCITSTKEAIEKGVYGDSWHLIQAQAQFKLGKYADSLTTVKEAQKRYSWSVRLRWHEMEVAKYVGESERLPKIAEEIGNLVQATPWRYTDARNLVTLGDFALSQGADAKDVQESFYQRARRNNPLHRQPVLALAELALSKRDFQLAAEILEKAVEKHNDDPDVHFGLARAFEPSDSKKFESSLKRVLKLNPNHLPARLLLVRRALAGEQYTEAESELKSLLKTNPSHPETLSLLSALAILKGDDVAAKKYRDLALKSWGTNPLVDHTIGRELSKKYRFQEGSKYQRQAIAFDATHLDAQKQLAQDLLRLGQEAEGWQLADAVYQTDQYDVSVFNLMALRDELEKFTTLSEHGFDVRMDALEARIYGDRVLTLLKEAREELCRKYELELPETILVEIFPNPDDFAVRTFGMPGVSGYLGVCFGDVITANSPASQVNNPNNWEAVLWHEFAHVVTLNKTNNRMPRWLSEGISVYEERQRDPSWGEQLNVAYRKMILGGELTPIDELSQAFIRPKSPLHVQFAYYQCSLVVEHLIAEHGFDALIKILDDLAIGMDINEAIERHTVPLALLNEEFQTKTIAMADAFGANIDWSKPDLDEAIKSPLALTMIIAWGVDHPDHYRGLKLCGDLLAKMESPEAAMDMYGRAIKLFPHETGKGSPILKLAELSREAGDHDREYELLIQYAGIDDDAAAVFTRLIELDQQREQWDSVLSWGQRLLAVKPLGPTPHLAIVDACDHLSKSHSSAPRLRALLEFESVNLTETHFRLAQQLKVSGELPMAKRHVLLALEEAPRFREALKLLLELRRDEATEAPATKDETKK